MVADQVHMGLEEGADRPDVAPVAVEEVGLDAVRVDPCGDDVAAEVDRVARQTLEQDPLSEHVDAHRAEVRLRGAEPLPAHHLLGQLHARARLGRRWLLAKLADPVVVVDSDRSEAGNLLLRARHHTDRDVGPVLDVVVEQGPVVHAVHVVAREDQDVVSRQLDERTKVLADRIRGALEPGLRPRRLLSGQDLHVTARESVEPVGATDVPVERDRVELGEHVHPLHRRVDRIRDRDVDQAVLSGNRHRRFGAEAREGIETGSAAAPEDEDGDVGGEIVETCHQCSASVHQFSPRFSPPPDRGRRSASHRRLFRDSRTRRPAPIAHR